MANDTRQSRRVLLGGLLILGLAGTAMLIFFLDDILNALRSRYTIVAVVQNAPDLAAGSAVWVAGREVGAVRTVGFMPAGSDTLARIAVVLELPRSVQSQIRADSRVRLTSENLISERVVDILPGTAGAPVLQPGDTLLQDLRPSATQLAERAVRVRRELDSVLVAARALSPALRGTLERTERAVDGLSLVMQEARRVQQDLDSNPGLAMLRDPHLTAALERVSTAVDQLPRLVSDLTREGGSAREATAALGRLQVRADSLRQLLATAADALLNPNGTLLRLQQDTAIQRAMAAARADLDSLIADVKRNPLRYAF